MCVLSHGRDDADGEQKKSDHLYVRGNHVYPVQRWCVVTKSIQVPRAPRRGRPGLHGIYTRDNLSELRHFVLAWKRMKSRTSPSGARRQARASMRSGPRAPLPITINLSRINVHSKRWEPSLVLARYGVFRARSLHVASTHRRSPAVDLPAILYPGLISSLKGQLL